MSPLILLAGAGVLALVIKSQKKPAAQSAEATAKQRDVAEILDEMPTQFWPDWHRSAASYLVQNLGIPATHDSVKALMGMADALAQSGVQAPDKDKFAQTIAVMVNQRRQQGKPLFWRTIFRSETAPYFVCGDGNINSPAGQCELAVPLPWDPQNFIVVKA